ncbi:TPA: bacteriocin immunity protein [Listeria innocua]|nr:bacteriocin immunity protein [Listeria innocua]
MKKNNNSEFLNLLKNVYNLESVKQDKEFSNLLITAINNLNSGNAKDIEIVRLEPFINKYLFSNPSQELIDLNLYMQKKQNKYRGLSSIINWF